jgi:hypothetical protein
VVPATSNDAFGELLELILQLPLVLLPFVEELGLLFVTT